VRRALGSLAERLTYANVVATLALFVSLSAGAYAAFHLGRNSVTSRNVVNGSLSPKDLRGHTGALAYARVNSVGEMDGARSHNVAKVKKVDSGLYCIRVTVPFHNVVASGNPVSNDVVAQGGLTALDSGVACNEKFNAFVLTFTGTDATQRVDHPFYVLFN
jgi:hypothetical protein